MLQKEIGDLIEELEEYKEEAEAQKKEEAESMCTVDLIINNIEEDGIYHQYWESNVCDALVDFGLLAARIGLNVGRKHPKYRHPYSGQDIYYSVDTLVKAQAEAWAAWGVDVGDLRRRLHRRRPRIGGYSRTVYQNVDRTELVLRAQIEAYEAWGIDPVNIKRELHKRLNERAMAGYQEVVEEYFHRMATPLPLPDEKLMTHSCPDLREELDDLKNNFPLRYSLSLPAGLDIPDAHAP